MLQKSPVSLHKHTDTERVRAKTIIENLAHALAPGLAGPSGVGNAHRSCAIGAQIIVICEKCPVSLHKHTDTERVWEVTNTDQPCTH